MSETATEHVGSTGTVYLVLASVGLVWYCILWAVGILGCSMARKRYRLRPRSPLASQPAASVPGVSVLRPLRGLDTNLYENLESTFKQDYPNFEVLLSVADESDQALPIVRDLIAKYPQVDAHLIIGEEVVGVNPKVNNLMRSYRQAKNDILWVLDSNILVHPGTLARSVDALQKPTKAGKRIAVVHHVPYAHSTVSDLGSRVEEAFLNTNHAKMYIAINTVAIESCVVGKSNLYRRSDLERVNGSMKPIPNPQNLKSTSPGTCGLPAFARFLAEDNCIASSLWHELDVRHDLSCDVAQNVVGRMSFMDYVWRRVRWIRVRKHMVLSATLLEPFTESAVLAVIGASSANYIFSCPAWLFVTLHTVLWLQLDLDVYQSLAGHPLPSSIRWQFLGGWFVRELMALPIFLLAIFGNTVVWRGRQYQVLRNGEVKQANGDETVLGWLRHTRRNQYQRLQTDPDPEDTLK